MGAFPIQPKDAASRRPSKKFKTKAYFSENLEAIGHLTQDNHRSECIGGYFLIILHSRVLNAKGVLTNFGIWEPLLGFAPPPTFQPGFVNLRDPGDIRKQYGNLQVNFKPERERGRNYQKQNTHEWG